MAETVVDFLPLQLERIIGFDGSVTGGLKVHPNRQHLIYPLGCNVVIEEITKDACGEQSILSAHTDRITCLAVSNSGKYLASGQITHMGYKASIHIWDFDSKTSYRELVLHKVKVESLTFSNDDRYLISLGGQDDGSVVVWDVETGNAICGSPAQVESAGNTFCVCASQRSENVFVTAGANTLRVWKLDVENRKIWPTDVNLGALKRIIRCIEMVDAACPPYFLCGTTTGDILVINMDSCRLACYVPEKDNFSLGVTALACVKGEMVYCGENRDGSKFALPCFDLLVGSGDGSLGQYKLRLTQQGKTNRIKATFTHRQNTKRWHDDNCKNKTSPLTSIALRGEGHQFFVGSANSQIYRFNYSEFKCELTKTCHSSAVNDVIFPFGCPDLIITCQDEEIRIWSVSSGKEIRRYVVSNMTCNGVDIMRDGKTIVSAWADGKIRAYGFDDGQNLTQKWIINDAHNKGVTAIACTSDGRGIISGGGEGQVRIWSVDPCYDSRGRTIFQSRLIETMKEHKGSVCDIKIRDNDRECVSASSDGTTTIWDLEHKRRSQTVFANTLFRCVCYGSGGCHIVTSGSDRKIAYWETLTGSLIRELDGAKAGAVNAMDMSPDGKYFVTGGEEKLLKVWKYDEGEVTYAGIGHSAPIKKIRISPCQRKIVSVGDDGAILFWRFPGELQ